MGERLRMTETMAQAMAKIADDVNAKKIEELYQSYVSEVSYRIKLQSGRGMKTLTYIIEDTAFEDNIGTRLTEYLENNGFKIFLCSGKSNVLYIDW